MASPPTKKIEIYIPHWHPTRLNSLLNCHWGTASKKKRSDAAIIAHYGRSKPKARGRRMVSLDIVLKPKERGGDVDSYWKTTLDGLQKIGLLKNDSHHHCQTGIVKYTRGTAATWGTWIILEDIA